MGPSLLHSLSRGVQRIQPRPSIQPIIKFIFSPNFVGLETCDMRQRKTPFCVSNFETKQKTEIFTRGIRKSGYLWICTEKSGYPDKIGMRGRSAVVSIIPPFFPDKKIVNLPGSGFFFPRKKKKSGIPDKSGGRPSWSQNQDANGLPKNDFKYWKIKPIFFYSIDDTDELN